jgi:hypothetical protein
MAKWCFSLGIVSQIFSVRMSQMLTASQRLKKIEVVEDEESDIVDAVRRMSSNYDFIVTRYEIISYFFTGYLY